MSNKNLRIIFGFLVGLLLAFFALRVVAGSRGGRVSGGPEFGGAVDSTLSLVRVLGPGADDSVRLERHSDGWTVNGYPADAELVEGLVSAIDTAEVGQVIARNPENYERLGVTKGHGRRVEIGAGGKTALSFWLGGKGGGVQAPTAPGAYRFIRFDNAPEVYRLDGPLGRLLLRRTDAWRDRIIARADTAAIQRIEIRRGKRHTEFVRGDGGWTIDGAAADSTRVSELLGSLAELRTGSFPADSVALRADFDAPDATLTAFGRGAEEPEAAPLLTLLFDRIDGPAYLVRRADRPLVFELAEWATSRLLGPEEKSGS